MFTCSMGYDYYNNINEKYTPLVVLNQGQQKYSSKLKEY